MVALQVDLRIDKSSPSPVLAITKSIFKKQIEQIRPISGLEQLLGLEENT
jgi:hypothetical protein